ncbi:MAG: zinc ribbon domain-containing protein [Gemmatimonadota bacterium]|nr:zinc ribbon domain-containing protein [Gemmatimonadota bacterium]
MDDLDRVFHRLVSNIRHRHPEYLTLPFTVQELYETLIPYRHHRRELGIETNQDYEIAVTRLLSGERDYLQSDPEMRDKLEAELASPHFDTGAFREFAGAKVSLAPEALRRIRALTVPAAETPAASKATASAPPPPPMPMPSVASPAGGAVASGAAVSGTPAPAGFSATFPLSSSLPAADAGETGQAPAGIPSLGDVAVPEGCPFCGGTLPEGRTVIYCPNCGNNLSVSRCPACGGELEKGWKFCVTCGRSVA